MPNFKMRRAFTRGFREGFSAPFAVFAGVQSAYSYKPRNIVSLSWAEVGGYLSEATQEYGRVIEQSSSKEKAERRTG
jgi:hypothetical protein